MTGVAIAFILFAVLIMFLKLQKVIYKRQWNKRLIYNVVPSKPAVFEGENIYITDSLTNGKSFPLPWVHISYKISYYLVYLDNINKKVDRGETRELLYTVGMNKTVTRRSTVQCTKRGFYSIRDSSVSCNDLFMSKHLTDRLIIPFGLLVYPKRVDYPSHLIPIKKMLGDSTVRRFIDPDPFTFKGIREYQPYDSFRQINWRATAKAGGLMSNIYDFTVSQDISIILNLQDYCVYERDFVHEEAIRIAAFICRECIKMGVAVSLTCPSEDGSPKHISAGMSASHLEAIYASLAYIDLKAMAVSMSGSIPVEPDRAFILVSSYHKQDMYDKFMYARGKGVGAAWIIPMCERDEAELVMNEDIVRYEVREND